MALINLQLLNLQTLVEGNQESTRQGKLLHAHGLEETISLKCLCYKKQSKDSVQFLLKIQHTDP